MHGSVFALPVIRLRLELVVVFFDALVTQHWALVPTPNGARKIQFDLFFACMSLRAQKPTGTTHFKLEYHNFDRDVFGEKMRLALLQTEHTTPPLISLVTSPDSTQTLREPRLYLRGMCRAKCETRKKNMALVTLSALRAITFFNSVFGAKLPHWQSRQICRAVCREELV